MDASISAKRGTVGIYRRNEREMKLLRAVSHCQFCGELCSKRDGETNRRRIWYLDRVRVEFVFDSRCLSCCAVSLARGEEEDKFDVEMLNERKKEKMSTGASAHMRSLPMMLLARTSSSLCDTVGSR